ncbi:ATP-binding protein [Goekera deserti]|uniref:ATP-binding protein n=1 Tax=Goekera deserti TaxID=2497753 RepID=UPI0015752F05|nr:ATP-binding protein [Goekera deserti]
MGAGRPAGRGTPGGPPADAGVFAGGGECGLIMAGHDWDSSPVGPVSGWPASLRFAVRTVLASRFPMVLTWGSHFTQFYNDGYAPCIGAKHPAIGEDIRVTLAEGWDALGPPIEHAMTTHEASWLPRLPLPLERAGYREETYFTVSHAPAFGDDGAVAGMHAVLTEVTGEVLGERRQHLLHELSTAVRQLGDERETAAQLCAALAAAPMDVPCAAVYLRAGAGLERIAVVGCADDAFPAHAGTGDDALPRGLAEHGVTGGPWGDPVTEAVALPLAAGPDGLPMGVLVAGVNPNRALDGEYRAFHALLAGQFSSALVDARAFDAERRRSEALAELDRAKTAFFADVSHELRTPLTLLLGPLADVLDDGAALSEGSRQQLDMALRNGRRLQRLVNDLLDFVSIEAGRAGAVRVQTDVPGFTTELVGVLRAAAERAGLRLTVDCPPLPRPAHVDPRMWEKIVLNLVSNAVKYTFVGGIDVVLRADGDQFVLTVDDTGIGIAEQDLPHLFERFYRGAQNSARSREGTGIGLALVRELAELHGGTVTARSRAGAGSSFTVRLPFGAPDAPGGPVVAMPSPGARGVVAPWVEEGAPAEWPATPPGAPVVLVVDDNADMRTYLTRVLSPGWSVRTAADGHAALAAARREVPDLVLTDVMMPGMDGFDLLRCLREEPLTRGVPVIMLTARAGQEAAVEGLEAGADDYLAKPFQAAELTARMRVALDRARGVSPEAGPPTPLGEPLPFEDLPGDSRPAPAPVVPVVSVPAPVVVPQQEPAPSGDRGAAVVADWQFPAEPASVPSLRRRLRTLLAGLELDDDEAYDLLVATCEAATNAVEHAQDPSEPRIDVTVRVLGDRVEVAVRDHGRWRERVPSMDRGRGSVLMSAFADVNAVPSPEGTTVVIRTRPS